MKELFKMEYIRTGVKMPVICRTWLVPLIKSIIVAVILRVIFNKIPENIITTDFLAGYWTCISWYYFRSQV